MQTAATKNNSSAAVAAPFDPATQPTLADIQVRLDALVVAMTAKALREPEARFSIKSQAESYLALAWRTKPNGPWADGHQYFNGDARKTLAEAEAFVRALPSPEEARMKAFLESLGETIELGKKSDIAVEHVNPLIVLMKALSKNALEHRVSA